MSTPADWVVLFHHGHSGWAPSGCFTGWADISLTGVGLAFDEVRGSVLRRTFVLVPRLAAGRRILAMSHGNTLCGLVMHLDGPRPRRWSGWKLHPLIYRFTSDLSVTGRVAGGANIPQGRNVGGPPPGRSRDACETTKIVA